MIHAWCDVISQVLEKDPDNVKARFRRAQAYMMTQDYIEAKQDLNLALKAEPNNRCVLPLTLHSSWQYPCLLYTPI